MKITACIMVNDQSFSFSISEGNTISIGAHASADVVISQFNKVIDIHLDKGTVKLCTKQGSSMNVSTAGFDQFVILDQDFRIAAYFTEEVIEEKTFRLPFEGEVSVGRSGKASSKGDTNDIIINLPYISSFHFKIICKKNQTLVCDCDSKNGLYLNGSLVRKAVLHDGDIISVFTARIIFKDNTLFFENVGSHIQMKRLPAQKCYEEAPKNPVTNRDFYCSRSPRLVSAVNKEVINLEKPPHVEAAPQINWINVLLTPAISIGLMLVLVVAMGMNAVMLIMSGGMSLVSAVVAYVNYNKQKAQHNNKDALINTKYRAYLADVSSRLEQARTHQLSSLTSANPAPADCLKIAKDRKPQLWERSLSDEDALCVRVGTGTIPAAVSARYQQAQVVFTEEQLETEAKKIASDSVSIDNAPITCNLSLNKQVGIVGNQSDESQLVRNMIVEVAAAHAYDEVKLVALIPKQTLPQWDWIRWLPHCADEQRKEKYLFTSSEDAEPVLDAIAEVLGKRAAENADSYQVSRGVTQPHYIFIIANPELIEKHPIRKYLLDTQENLGCTSIFVLDRLTYLPKECDAIIDVSGGTGELYRRLDSSCKQQFRLDAFSVENADVFARSLAPLYINTISEANHLPSCVSFLDGYHVQRPAQLNLQKRWNNAKTYKSLSVPIGAMAGGDSFFFDIHEKRHGVNGIVAGMPGSGKTEMVQSWLLSLAVNYAPQDVSFVLIDFKGTGMIAPFRNLPHLAGSISNLDKNIDRNLTAIRSEVHRREALIDKYSDHNVKNVNDLNKAYEKGSVPERLPILLIVIDEFAEFKKNFPDFGAEIDSLTSKGRALGIFVVLMTQKPAGVVSAKSEDNIKFRWCLRVANYSASREMIGCSDAAKINVPGRAYVKVGEDDVFEQVQSFWSGAPYDPDKQEASDTNALIYCIKPNGKWIPCEEQIRNTASQSNMSEIDVVVDYISEFCKTNRIPCADKVWADKLPERIALPELLTECFNGSNWSDSSVNAPVIGLVDEPETQRQYPLKLNLDETGHVIVYGAPASGKTTLLKTLIVSLAMHMRPGQVNIYVMDFGGWNMSVLKELPHIGGIANDNEPERIKKLVVLLQDILSERKNKFSGVGVGNIRAYREATGDFLPDIILAIDNFGPVLKLYPDLDMFFANLASSGANYGVYMVATAAAANAVPMKISQNIKYALALQMVDKSDYTYIVGKTSRQLPEIVGRGFTKGVPPLEFQTALPAHGKSDKEVSDNIQNLAKEMRNCWDGALPAMIPEMPEVIPFGSVQTNGICLGLSLDKVRPVVINFAEQHFLFVSGTVQSGKTNLLLSLARQLKQQIGGMLHVFDVKRDANYDFADSCLHQAEQIDSMIEELRPELQSRQKEKQSNPSKSFSPIIIAIDDYPEFFKLVNNDTIARLLAMVKLGSGLNVYLIVAGEAYELATLTNKGEALSIAMAKGKYAIMLGGCISDHGAITTKVPYAQRNTVVKAYEGYLVDAGEVMCFKAMKNAEEV